MKRTITLALFLLVAGAVSAQVPFRFASPKAQAISKTDLLKAKSEGRPAVNSGTRDIYEMYIDYSAANFDDLFYVWNYNSAYTAADTTVNYHAVVMNHIVGYTDPNDPVGTYIDWSSLGLNDSFPDNISVTIDSIYVAFTHENNSASLNYAEMRIMKLLTNGTPSTSTSSILWSQEDSVDYGLSPSNDWLSELVVLAYGPGYTPEWGQKVAAQFIYTDATDLDTLGMLSGCIDDGTGTAIAPSVYGTSWMKYPPFLPNAIQNVNVIYVDAQGNQVGFFDAQNWIYWFKVTINTEPVGIADNFDNLKVTAITPNPASGQTSLLYGLNEASDVKIDLFDLSGKFIRNIYNGNDGAGSYIRNIDVADLSNGAYLVSATAGNGEPVVSKMIVSQ